MLPLLCRSALTPPLLTVNATVLQSSGDGVTLSWSGVPNPSMQDWIGLWSADNSTLFAWFFAYDQPTYHRKQSKWPQMYPPPSRNLRESASNTDIPGPVQDVLPFSSDIALGTGSATFRLYNFRLSGYKFLYYSESSPLPSDPALLTSPVVTFARTVDEGTQVRLALTTRPGEMRVRTLL